MKCPKCHEKIQFTDATCPYCGYTISESNDLYISTQEELEDRRTNHKKEQDAYLQNNAYASGKNWVNRYQQKYKRTMNIAKITISGILIMFISVFFIIMIASRTFALIVPMMFILFVFGIILFSLFKGKTFVVKEYGKYTIVVYSESKYVVVVIDDEEVMRTMVTSFPFELNLKIPKTDIPVKVILKPLEYIIKVNNED